MRLEPIGKLRPATLSLFTDPLALEEYEQAVSAARCTTVRQKIQARRVASEEALTTLLPARIQPGESWHVMSAGDVDALSYLAHLLRHQRFDYVALSTWCMAGEDVAQLGLWIDEGRIGRLDAYCGEIFPSQYPDAHAALCAVARRCGGRVAIFRNHAKLFVCIGDNTAYAIESSANINTNPRAEQTALHASDELAAFYKAYFDGIRSYLRDFDDWQPMPTHLDAMPEPA